MNHLERIMIWQQKLVMRLVCLLSLQFLLTACGNEDANIVAPTEIIAEQSVSTPTRTPEQTQTVEPTLTLSPELQELFTRAIESFDAEELGFSGLYELEFVLEVEGEVRARSLYEQP